jgi:hypothetical protein
MLAVECQQKINVSTPKRKMSDTLNLHPLLKVIPEDVKKDEKM